MKYTIVGEPLPVVLVELNSGETIYSEVGGRIWAKGRVETNTQGGGLGRMMGRMLSGESLFLSHYTAIDHAEIAFASSFPGSIRAYELQAGESIICQKRAFLAAQESVKLEASVQKRFSSGLVSGEGFILQKLTGPGIVFVEIDGYAVDYDLEVGEEIVCDTGVMAVMDETCSLEIVTVKGLKNKLVGGEGLFDTVIKGPGKVTLQTMTVNGLARVVSPFIAK